MANQIYPKCYQTIQTTYSAPYQVYYLRQSDCVNNVTLHLITHANWIYYLCKYCWAFTDIVNVRVIPSITGLQRWNYSTSFCCHWYWILFEKLLLVVGIFNIVLFIRILKRECPIMSVCFRKLSKDSSSRHKNKRTVKNVCRKLLVKRYIYFRNSILLISRHSPPCTLVLYNVSQFTLTNKRWMLTLFSTLMVYSYWTHFVDLSLNSIAGTFV